MSAARSGHRSARHGRGRKRGMMPTSLKNWIFGATIYASSAKLRRHIRRTEDRMNRIYRMRDGFGVWSTGKLMHPGHLLHPVQELGLVVSSQNTNHRRERVQSAIDFRTGATIIETISGLNLVR